jgi:transcriptional regulator with XRE-family HTH domain
LLRVLLNHNPIENKESQMEFESFGRKVQNRRVEEGWSQEELAEKAEISRTYLSQIERGVATNLSWQVVQRLVTVLGLRSSDAFEEQPSHGLLPSGLNDFAEKVNLPAGDVEMLASISYRGNQPTTPEGWQLLYNTIRVVTEEK